jgi:Zn-dependent protease with chaperone function
VLARPTDVTVVGQPGERLKRNRIVCRMLMLALAAVFVACGLIAALPLATLRSLVLDPLGLAVPFSWVLDLGAAFVIGGSLMVAMRVRRAKREIALPRGARLVSDAGLRRAVRELAAIAGLSAPPRLLILPIDEPNAFAYGFGRDSSSIVLYQGIIDLLDAHELRGVLAHEISHIANEDTRLIALVEAFNRTAAALRGIAGHFNFAIPFRDAFRGARSLLLGIGVLCMVDWLGARLLGGAPKPSDTLSVGRLADEMAHVILGFLLCLVVIAIVYKALSTGWKAIAYIALFTLVGFLPYVEALAHPVLGYLLGCAISRQREFIADADAARITGDPWGLVSALRRLEACPLTPTYSTVGSRYAMFCPLEQPQRWWSRLYATHPPLRIRRERLEALADFGQCSLAAG